MTDVPKQRQKTMAEKPNCARCGHPQDWHRHDDADTHSPDDPNCPFRCIGYDCMAPGPPLKDACDCPDYVEAEDHG